MQQPFLWIIQLSHPTRSGRVRVSSEQWGSAGPSVGAVAFHSPHDLADGGAVLGQVGLAAARVGEQDLAQMAHHQRQRQQLGGFGVVVVTGISGGLVDLLGRKAPAQQARACSTPR